MFDTSLYLLCAFSFCAGFIDAIVGGGGLIQTPALLFLYPHQAVPALLATTKIPSFSGTALATYTYSKKVTMHTRLLVIMGLTAFGASMLGSSMVSRLPNQFLKPFMLCLLTGIAIYTFINKSFGQSTQPKPPMRNAWPLSVAIVAVIGFYDGFFGPGTGSFLILLFIGVMGLDFLHASAHAKSVNLATNMASIIYFGLKGLIIWHMAIPMAVSNLCGSFFGARLAILKGNRLVRYFFLVVICCTILRFAYDLFVAGQ